MGISPGRQGRIRVNYKPERIDRGISDYIRDLDPENATKLGITPNGPESAGFNLTDYGNAERLVSRHGGDIRYCYQTKQWYCWDSTRWAPDSGATVEHLAKDTVRSIYAEASATQKYEDRKSLSDWARRSEKANQISAMIALARSEPGIAVLPNELDSDPWKLNVTNGTIDLKTGELLPHRREDLITKLAPVAYDPDAKCPRWEQFLSEVFEPHPDLIPFVQRAIGYALSGSTREECLFLCFGPQGRNGKGTLMRTMGLVLGDYGHTADFSTFVAWRDDSKPRDDIANMSGKRFVTAQESRQNAEMAENIVKVLTGGDRLRARRLHENSSEFDPTHKIFLGVNHKPVVKGTDGAIWSRIKLIPFEVSFEGREDKNLKSALLDELPGILTWAVEGCLRWQEEGLDVPDTVTTATQGYRLESDQVGRFVSECCLVGDFASAKARPLYLAYKKWTEEAGEAATTEVAFSTAMTDRNYKKEHTKSGNMYRGICIKTENQGEGLYER